jgi:hypothetical protein
VKRILSVLLIIVVIIIIVMFSTFYRRGRHFSTFEMAYSETITRLTDKVSSKEEALEYFNKWLVEETDYNGKNNTIERVESYRGYYEIKIEIAITINGRIEGNIGYSMYVVTKDGYLKGYALSK